MMRGLCRRDFLKAAGLAAAATTSPLRASYAKQQQGKKPNILLAISDDQSYPHASVYGCKGVDTPAFDRVANEGVLFNNAFVASPGCSPSRAALLTGRFCWQLEHAGTHASEFPAKYITYTDILESAGYHIGFTGKGWGPGNYEDSGRKRNPAGPEYAKRKLDPPEGIADFDYAANFKDFLDEKKPEQPFCFWYGAKEPHRVFKKGIGLEHGKKLEDADVPSFLPDVDEVRSDILDYYFEIEWYDDHLGKIIKILEENGELDNTIIVATSDNGMAFPRAKANLYEYGFHVPLAIRWADKVSGRRVIDDLVSLIDLAPTFLEATGTAHPSEKTGKFPMTGRSLMNILSSDKDGVVDETRVAAYSARERHSSSRYNNLGYPQRCLRTSRYLYTRNFAPDRWPAGAPQKYGDGNYPKDESVLGPMHTGGYHDIDACPTKTYLVENRDNPEVAKYFHLAVDKRPAEELFDLSKDPGCLVNLADSPEHAAVKKKLTDQLESRLRETGDPRVLGNGGIFETYKRYSPLRKYPPPD